MPGPELVRCSPETGLAVERAGHERDAQSRRRPPPAGPAWPGQGRPPGQGAERGQVELVLARSRLLMARRGPPCPLGQPAAAVTGNGRCRGPRGRRNSPPINQAACNEQVQLQLRCCPTSRGQVADRTLSGTSATKRSARVSGPGPAVGRGAPYTTATRRRRSGERFGPGARPCRPRNDRARPSRAEPSKGSPSATASAKRAGGRSAPRGWCRTRRGTPGGPSQPRKVDFGHRTSFQLRAARRATERAIVTATIDDERHGQDPASGRGALGISAAIPPMGVSGLMS